MFQELVFLGSYVLVGILGWISRQLWNAVGNLKDDLSSLKSEIAGLGDKFVRKDDYRRDIDEMKSMLRDIRDKLDGKVDK